MTAHSTIYLLSLGVGGILAGRGASLCLRHELTEGMRWGLSGTFAVSLAIGLGAGVSPVTRPLPVMAQPQNGDRPAPESSGPPAPDASVTLRAISTCESGGDPRAISRDGRYRGKYQFDRPTWRSVGGRGDPAMASEVQQDHYAEELLRVRGSLPWPVCGRIDGGYVAAANRQIRVE